MHEPAMVVEWLGTHGIQVSLPKRAWWIGRIEMALTSRWRARTWERRAALREVRA
jgi:hypothetical protein